MKLPIRILYVCPEAPWPLVSGGRFRISALHRALSAAGETSLLVIGDRSSRDVRRRIRESGGWVYPSRRETPPGRLRRILWNAATGRCIPAARYLSPRRLGKVRDRVAEARPDVVVLGDAYLAAAFLPVVQPLARAVIIDTHDAASLVHQRIAEAATSLPEALAYRLLARNTFAMEARYFPRADQVWTVSEEDADYYRRRHGIENVAVVPIAVDTQPLPEPRPPEEPGAIVFTGSFSYWPNEDAALRLIEMAPRLRRRGALRELSLVGIDPTPRMFAAAAAVEGVVITGRVPEVAPFLDRAALVVAPLAAGSGMKVKLLEGMARARPVLTTPFGAEGLAIRPGVHAEIVPLGQFEDKLAELMRDPLRRAALAAEGRRLVEALYSPAAAEHHLRDLLDRVLNPQGREPIPTRP